jgi:hypothetical protein
VTDVNCRIRLTSCLLDTSPSSRLSCRTISVIEDGTSTSSQMRGSRSLSSMRDLIEAIERALPHGWTLVLQTGLAEQGMEIGGCG